ncbi:hypothetical protein [Longispora urticae]
MSDLTVAEQVPQSPITALIRLLSELVLDVHKAAEGADLCIGCALASGAGQSFPCWPADTARHALRVVGGG